MSLQLYFEADDWSVDAVIQGPGFKLQFWMSSTGMLELASSCCGAQESLENPHAQWDKTVTPLYACVKCSKPVEWREVVRKVPVEEAEPILASWLELSCDPLTAQLAAVKATMAVEAMITELKPYYDSHPPTAADEVAVWEAMASVAARGRTPL